MLLVRRLFRLWPPFGTEAITSGPAYHVDAGQIYCPGVAPGQSYSGGSLAGQIAA